MTSAVPVRLTRAQSRQRTRTALVSAAMSVVARSGYAGASVDAIAAQAGFTVGALYANFGTKEELFLAAFERHCAGELAALRELTAEAANVAELLAAVTRRFADLDEAHREWSQLGVELWLFAQRNPRAADHLITVQDETRQVIAEALRREGEPVSDEAVAVVHALWTGFMMYRLINPDALAADAFSRAVGWLLAGQSATAKPENQPRRKGR
jgi:AcrR family transcriptional regulator